MRLSTLACLLLAFTSPVRAAEFELSPTRVQLDARHLVETVRVGNSGTAPLAFEVSVQRWRVDADGVWQLEPSDDLVVHPLLLEIPSNGKARLRIGLLVPPDMAGQVAYRIELHEQPSATTQVDARGVRMLTKVSMPVFVDGAHVAAAAPAMTDVRWRSDRLEFRLRDGGDAYLPPQALELRVLGPGGAVLSTQRLRGNYVLGHSASPVRARVPAEQCVRATSLRLHLAETGETLERPWSRSACAP